MLVISKGISVKRIINYIVGTDDKVNFHVWPDILIARGMQVFCTIEVKNYQMLPKYNDGSTGIVAGILSQDKIPAFMRQLIVQMVYHERLIGSSYGYI